MCVWTLTFELNDFSIDIWLADSSCCFYLDLVEVKFIGQGHGPEFMTAGWKNVLQLWMHVMRQDKPTVAKKQT